MCRIDTKDIWQDMDITNIKRKCRQGAFTCVCGKFFVCSPDQSLPATSPSLQSATLPADPKTCTPEKTRHMTQRLGNKSAQITITKGSGYILLLLLFVCQPVVVAGQQQGLHLPLTSPSVRQLFS